MRKIYYAKIIEERGENMQDAKKEKIEYLFVFDNNSPHTCDFSRELGEKDNSGCDFCISWY